MDPRIARRENVHSLRQNPSPPERLTWEIIRGRKLFGLKFRRQHGMGPFVFDFFCSEKKLVLEIDGKCHQSPDQAERDQNRDDWIRSQGLSILRLPAAGLSEDAIKAAIGEIVGL